MSVRIVCFTAIRRAWRAARGAVAVATARPVRRIAPLVVCVVIPTGLWMVPAEVPPQQVVADATMPTPMAPVLSEQALLEVTVQRMPEGTAPEPAALGIFGFSLLGLLAVVCSGKRRRA